MDIARRNEINDLTQQVIEMYDIEIPITDIDEIVYCMGGEIEERERLNDFCDGTVLKVGDDNFRIAISRNQSRERRLSSIAHELGHLFLHMGFQTNWALWKNQEIHKFKRFGLSEQEFEANEFAASLLMPEDLFWKALQCYKIGNQVNVVEVAHHFNVSKLAAINRGKFLGYFR